MMYKEYIVPLREEENDCGLMVNAVIRVQPELIRCRDCKWYKTNYRWNGQEVKVCVIEPYEPIRKDDDYCSYGERKGND